MDDIDEIIKRANHFRFNEAREIMSLNRISHLPSSKKKLKAPIVERISLLVNAYISLASFISDENVDFLIANHGNKDKEIMKKISSIYKGVSDDIERLKAEIKEEIRRI